MMLNKKSLIAILNYNGTLDTINCIQSLYNYDNTNLYTIVVLDNNSIKDEIDLLKKEIFKIEKNIFICTTEEYKNTDVSKFSLVLVLSPENLGFAKGNNEIIRSKLDQFKYVVLLNNDTEVIDDTTQKLCNYIENNNTVGIVSCAIYYFDAKNKIWNAGGKQFFGTRKYYTNEYVEKALKEGVTVKSVDYITGCYFVTKAETLKKVGLLSEKFFFGEEDYEFSLRLKNLKYDKHVLLDHKIYHKVGASIKKDNQNIYRKSFVHHLNRFIDMKKYYNNYAWFIWRVLSSIYIFILLLKLGEVNINKGISYIVNLNRYAKKYDGVEKEMFEMIISGQII